MDRGGRREERQRQQSVSIPCQRPLRPPDQGDLKTSMDGRQRGQQPSPSCQNAYPEGRVDQDPSGGGGGHFRGRFFFNRQLTDDSGAGEVETSKLVVYSCRTAGWSCSYCLAITQLVGDKSTVFAVTTQMKKPYFQRFSRIFGDAITHAAKAWPVAWRSRFRIRNDPPVHPSSPSTHVLAPQGLIKTLRVLSKASRFHSQATEMQLWWPWPLIYAFWNRNSLSLSQCCAYLLYKKKSQVDACMDRNERQPGSMSVLDWGKN